MDLPSIKIDAFSVMDVRSHAKVGEVQKRVSGGGESPTSGPAVFLM
jgi:hypothetical protein